MAHEFSITGGKHIHFRMVKEDFDYYFYKNHIKDGYYDLRFGILYWATGPGIDQSMSVCRAIGIIRIVFK